MAHELRELGLELKKGFSKLNDLFTGVTELLKEAMDGEGANGIASHQAEEWYPLFGSLVTRAQGNWELWTAFTAEDPEDNPPMARWLTLAESGALFDIEVNASPILAAEMLRIGYLTAVTPMEKLDAEVDALATILAGNAPVAMRGMKRAINEIARDKFDEAAAEQRHRDSMRGAEIKEGVAAYAEKRAPRF